MMTPLPPNLVSLLGDAAQCQELDLFLADRIDEFNSQATGYFDGNEGRPKGHSDIVYVKLLQGENGA